MSTSARATIVAIAVLALSVAALPTRLIAAPDAPSIIPTGSSVEEVTRGQAIFFGEVKGGTCVGCHGAIGRGSPAGGALTGQPYLWSDGSVEGIAATISAGVARPKRASGIMPALGGAPLDPADVHAVAAYVWTLGRHAG